MTRILRMWIFAVLQDLLGHRCDNPGLAQNVGSIKSHIAVWITVVVPVILLLGGCGSASVEDRFLARAKARAAAKDAEEADEAANPQPAPAPPPAEATVAAPTMPAASPAPVDAAIVVSEPVPAESSAPSSAPIVVAEPPSPMALDRGGRFLAFDRGESRVGLFDMQKKQIIRTVGTAEYSPSVFALDPGGRRLMTADNSGNVQNFSVDEIAGLDAFERRRRRGQVASSGQFAHSRPITAIAPMGYSGEYITGDDSGELRLWNDSSLERSAVESQGEQVIGLQSYGDGKFLFAAVKRSNSSDGQQNSTSAPSNLGKPQSSNAAKAATVKPNAGKIVFWRLSNGLPDVNSYRDYVETVGVPTRMVQSGSGGGLAVGDTTGQVRVWAPQDGKVQPSVLSPSTSPVTGLAFVDGAKGVVTSDEQGNIRRFSLPVVERRGIDLPSVDVRLLSVTDDSKSVILSAGNSLVELGVTDSKVKRRYNVAKGRSIANASTLDANTSSLIAAATNDGAIEFFEAATGSNLGSVSLDDQVSVMLPVADDGSVVFATQSGRYGKIIGPSQSFSLAQTGTHSMIASDGTSDQVVLVAKQSRLARVYDAGDGRIIASTSLASMPGELTAMAIRDGVVIFGNNQGEMWVWQSGQQRSRPIVLGKLPKPIPLRAIHIADAGRLRVVDDSGSVRTLNVAEMNDEATAAVQFGFAMTKISLGDMVAVSTTDDEVGVIHQDSTEASRSKLPRGKISAIAASPLTVQFVVASDQGDLWLSSKAELTNSIQLPEAFVCRQLMWSANGQTIVASDGRRIVSIDSKTLKIVSEHIESEGISELYPRANGGCVTVDARGAIRRRALANIAWAAEDPVRILDLEYRPTEPATVLAVTESGEFWEIDPQSGSVTASHQITDKELLEVHVLDNDLVLALEGGSGRILDCTDPASPKAWREGSVPASARMVTRNKQSRMAMIGTDGQVSVIDVSDPSGMAIAVTVENAVENLAFLDSSTLAIKTSGKASLQIVPIDENGRGIGTSFTKVSDLIGMPTGDAIAIADSSPSVTIMNLDTSQSKILRSKDGLSIHRLAVNHSGTRIAAFASAANQAGSDDTILLWDVTQNDAAPLVLEFPSPATAVNFSIDGSRLHVALNDKTVRSFRVADGLELERQTLPDVARVLNGINLGSVWAGTDAGLVVRLPNQLERQLAAVDGPVRYLSASPNRYVLVVTDKSATIQSLEADDGATPKLATLAKGELKPLAVEVEQMVKRLPLVSVVRHLMWTYGS